ncbi:MAG: endonuclease III [Desulfovibrio sp.]
MTVETLKKNAQEIFTRLNKRYPAPEPALDYETPWQLLVATVLAAQCTDERVNKVTPALFAKWPDAATMAKADIPDLEKMVHSTGFFRNKAKNLKAAAERVTEVYKGELPTTMKEMITLGGVARKTANVVLSNGLGINEGIAVDTHVKRISFRLGLTENTSPVKVEKDLMPIFDQNQWSDINHYLVFFGREVCKARTPQCAECELNDICPKNGV